MWYDSCVGWTNLHLYQESEAQAFTHTRTQMVRQTNEAILYKKQINKLKMFQLINRGSVGDVPTSCLLRAHCRRTECIEHKYSVRAISLNIGCSIVGHDTKQTCTRTTIRPFQWQQRKMSHKIINIFFFDFVSLHVQFNSPNFCFFFFRHSIALDWRAAKEEKEKKKNCRFASPDMQ